MATGPEATQDELDDGYTLLVVSSPLDEDEVPSNDKSALESKVKSLGATACTWFDISLYKVLGDEQVKITKAGCPVQLTVEIPKALRKSGRTFYVLRCHDGKVTVAAQGPERRSSGRRMSSPPI